RRPSAPSAVRRIRLSDGHPRIGTWRVRRVLGMDRDDGWTRREGVPLSSRGSRLERSSVAAQDGSAVADDLHVLLGRAQLPGPFVLVGHSTGAQYVRIFAGRYREQFARIVLLDGQPAEAFEGLSAFPAFYSGFRASLRSRRLSRDLASDG